MFFTSSRKNNINSANYEKLRPHEWLCVRQNATPEEINENYRKLVRVIHPDKNNQCSDKLFMLITNAKDVLLGHSGNSSSMIDEDHQIDMVFEPFSVVLKKRNCPEIVELLQMLPKSAAEIRGAMGRTDSSFLNHLVKIAGNYAMDDMMLAYKKALELNFVCKKCGKQMHLDDICYCHKATTKCHCNARKCCDTKPEDRGNFF
ncbi:hypothetical protein niasHS_004528 [Heterodera schachtii]|uniref:J domain-containing protein n=2 Tax=Heterodera TaxID=34509 RepID=A0ABD2JMK5_HETSC